MGNGIPVNKLKAEWRAVRYVWKNTHADQSGWTHEYMQKVRDMVRHAPVTCAVFLGVLVIPTAIALGVAILV